MARRMQPRCKSCVRLLRQGLTIPTVGGQAGRPMNQITFKPAALVLALALLSPLAAPAQVRDTSRCLPAPLQDVSLGQDVIDRDGRLIGWVALDQCTDIATGRLHVRLSVTYGSELKALPLQGVTPTFNGVRLPVTVTEVLAVPSVQFAYGR